MENILERLPDLNFASDEDSDDADGNGEQSSTVFSRSAHLKSLGVEFAAIEADPVEGLGITDQSVLEFPTGFSKVEQHSFDKESMYADNRSTQSTMGALVVPGGGNNEHNPLLPENKDEEEEPLAPECEPTVITDADWDRFKSEFSKSLEASEKKIASGQTGDEGPPLSDLKQQLLYNAVLAMHTESLAADELEDDVLTAGPAVGSSEGPKSPSKFRRGLLSSSTLETIHESELDRLLESDAKDLSGSSLTSDSVGESLVSKPPPAPKLVWEKEDTGQLMKELELLSKSEPKGVRHTEAKTSRYESSGGWTKLDNELASPSLAQNGDKENGPIFIDLRPTQEELKSPQKIPEEVNDRSTSDDGESDDPYTWIAERKHIKHGLHMATPTAPPSRHSHLHTVPTPLSRHSHSQTRASESGVKSNFDSMSSTPTNTTNSHKTVSENIPLTQESKLKSIFETTTSKTVSGTHSQASIGTLAPEPIKSSTSDSGLVIKRQSNSSSLTLSSSLSEGEAPSPEGPGVKKGKSPAASPTKASPTKSKKASKKEAKKSKKSRKKEKERSSVKKDPAKSAQRKLARALVLERIRNDSLTTSSDEEHCLTPTQSRTIELSSSVSSSDAVIACQESEEDLLTNVDTGKLKQRLQKIIQSKKPPAQFVTPATNTVYHEEVSFEAQLIVTDPKRSTDALLVFPLSEDGLVSLPNKDEGDDLEVDLQTQLYFHLVFLTWLSSQAVADFRDKTHLFSQNDSSHNTHNIEFEFQELKDGNITVPSERSGLRNHLFWITGIQQTIHDGHPSLLVGISVPAHLKVTKSETNKPSNVGPDSEVVENASISSKLRAYLQTTSLNNLVGPVLGNSEIERVIPGAIVDKLSEISQLPLASFFNVQDDITSLTAPLSFYWHSGYHISSLPSDESLKTQAPMSTTVCTLPEQSLTNSHFVFTTLQSVYQHTLNLAGLRMVYGEKSIEPAGGDTSKMTLAFAIRAPDAIYRWLDIVGPEDSNLAKITDPNSLLAKFGSSESIVLQCVRTPYLAGATLAKWFSGRACLRTGSILGISDRRTKLERKKRQRVRFSESESEDGLLSPAVDVTFPPLISNRPCLIAHPYTKMLLVVAPLVPPSMYGTVLSTCSRLGFDILGVKRIRLNTKRATAMQIPKLFMANFTPSSTPPSPDVVDFVTHPLSAEHAQYSPPFPSVVLHLGAENVRLHSISLKEAICADLAATLELNPSLISTTGSQLKLDCPDSVLHTTEISQETTKVLGSFSLSTSVSTSSPKLHEERKNGGPLKEELCFVAVPQCTSLPKLASLLEKVYKLKPVKNHQSGFDASSSISYVANNDTEELGGFELLGAKVVPQIPRFHAKRLCPLYSADSRYQQAVNILSDIPATLLLFRGMNCNQRLASLIEDKFSRGRNLFSGVTVQQELEIIISKDFEDAFNLSSIFFSDKELFADSRSLGMAPYIPPSWLQDMTILHDLQSPSDPLLSVVTVCMSDARLVVKVLDKLCRSGFSFVGMRIVELFKEESEAIIEDMESDSSQSGGDSEAGLVVCVKRVNAVWCLKHVLSPLIEQRGKNSVATTGHRATLSCSDSFAAAVSDVKKCFPDGVHCKANSITQHYKIDSEQRDVFDELTLPESCQPTTNSSLFSFVSPLLETTGMVLPPSLLVQETRLSVAGFVEVIEFLSQSGFEMRGLKMVTLSPDTARELLRVCDCEAWMKDDDLCSGPCLVLVVKRDNAASCCHTIFKSQSAVLSSHRRGSSSVTELLSQMIVPNSAKQAQDTLKLLKVHQT